MSYASNWLNCIHENIQNRDAIESAKKEENRARNREMYHSVELMQQAQRNGDKIGESIARQRIMDSL